MRLMQTEDRNLALDAIARQRLLRAFRHTAAKQCLQWHQQWKERPAEAPVGTSNSGSATVELSALTRSDLDSLPHWCLLPPESLDALRGVVGAVYLAPTFRTCLDGQLLCRWREVLGVRLHDALLQLKVPAMKQLPPLPAASTELLQQLGSSILQASIADHVAGRLMPAPEQETSAELDPVVARDICSRALTLMMQLRETDAVEGNDLSVA